MDTHHTPTEDLVSTTTNTDILATAHDPLTVSPENISQLIESPMTFNIDLSQHHISLLLISGLGLLMFFFILSYHKRQVVKNQTSSPLDPLPKDKTVIGDREDKTSDSDKKSSWQEALQKGLEKTRRQFTDAIFDVFSRDPHSSGISLDESLKERLYQSDLGPTTILKLLAPLNAEEKDRYGSKESFDGKKMIDLLRSRILEIFSHSPVLKTLPETFSGEPSQVVIMMVGVNGVGKTTTTGKLASYYQKKDARVLLCAADTFRAGAIEQLKVWASRLSLDIIAHESGSDPASVAFDGMKALVARKHDILLIDTAGRLQNKTNLMQELAKIKKVCSKVIPDAPQHIWLVIDGTTGQNGLQQVRSFLEIVDINGIIVTKLDGTAKGGVLIAIADQFHIPIHFIGVGEGVDHLGAFVAEEFIDSLLPPDSLKKT